MQLRRNVAVAARQKFQTDVEAAHHVARFRTRPRFTIKVHSGP